MLFPAWPDVRGGPPVLVVDDDPSIRTTVSDVLDLEGYDVVTAANGAGARERPEKDIRSSCCSICGCR